MNTLIHDSDINNSTIATNSSFNSNSKSNNNTTNTTNNYYAHEPADDGGKREIKRLEDRLDRIERKLDTIINGLLSLK